MSIPSAMNTLINTVTAMRYNTNNCNYLNGKPRLATLKSLKIVTGTEVKTWELSRTFSTNTASVTSLVSCRPSMISVLFSIVVNIS